MRANLVSKYVVNKVLETSAQEDLCALSIQRNYGLGGLCRVLAELDSEWSRRMSRRIGVRIAYQVSVAGIIAEPTIINSNPLFKTALIREFLGLVEPGVPSARLVGLVNVLISIANRMAPNVLDCPSYFVLGTAIDSFANTDTEVDSDWAESDFAEGEQRSALNAYMTGEDAYWWNLPEVLSAIEVAKVAVRGEKQWQTGTNTKFNLVQEPIEELIDGLVSELRSQTGAGGEYETALTKAIGESDMRDLCHG